MRYRRAFIPGGCFFFTVVTEQRRPLFASGASVEVLRAAFRSVRKRRPFEIDAIVVMPDHLHCIWTLPPEDADFATRWRLIKTWFTKHCDPALRAAPDQVRAKRGELGLWQHRYWEHAIRDEADFTRHVEYIHFNPVKHGHVAAPALWPYSSFHRYVEAGVYAPDWGGEGVALSEVGGE
ncbi:MAG: transposase [Gallionellaceae bacterium]|nr:transposase [Gallionellaceae bacterium]